MNGNFRSTVLTETSLDETPYYPKFARTLLRINKNLVFTKINFRISFQLHFKVQFVQGKVDMSNHEQHNKSKKRKHVVISDCISEDGQVPTVSNNGEATVYIFTIC